MILLEKSKKNWKKLKKMKKMHQKWVAGSLNGQNINELNGKSYEQGGGRTKITQQRK